MANSVIASFNLKKAARIFFSLLHILQALKNSLLGYSAYFKSCFLLSPTLSYFASFPKAPVGRPKYLS